MPANQNTTPWTADRLALLKSLCEFPCSASWLADKINQETGSTFTRNAIIGKIGRSGIVKLDANPEDPNRPKKTRKPRNRIRPERNVVDLFEEMLPPPDFLGITFSETTNKTCMYPEGQGSEMLFCGQPRKDESSYCPGHHAICWTKPTGKRTAKWKLWGVAA